MTKDAIALARGTDADLFERTRSGDGDAFARLVDRHKDGLVNYLTRMTGCRDRAEDVAQDAFIRIRERSGAYREEGHLKPYLYRVATNLVISSERRQARWHRISGWLRAGASHQQQPAQQTRLLRRELRQHLAEAILELPPDFRAAVILRDVEDWSYAKIAEAAASSIGTVKSRIHRGRRLLRAALAPYVQESEKGR